MIYFEDMRDKWGFGDGDMEPDSVDSYRRIYIRTINVLAEKHGSRVRAMAYDRPGIHNRCMIEFVSVDSVNDEESLTWGDSEWDEIVEPDEAMNTAITEAAELGIDHFVRSFWVDEERFSSFLDRLRR